MRISSHQIFNIARQSMAGASQEVAKTQEQMSTGKRILNPGDDPVAATRVMQIEGQLSSINQYQKNIDIAQNNLSLEETVLSGVNNIVLRLQEIAISAGNTGTLTGPEFSAMSQEVDVRLDELVNLLNTQGAGGEYIFGGYKSSGAPFVGDSNTGFRYVGDEGQLKIKVANNTFVAATDSGKKTFMEVESAVKALTTSASSSNRAQPAAQIDIGKVVDQEAFDKLYPEDIVITFNADSNLTPPGRNFTATERSSGRVIAENQPFTAGVPIEVSGASVRITGQPAVGDQFFLESTDKQDLLTTVARFKNALQSFDGTTEGKESLGKMVAATLGNLANAQGQVQNVVSSIGARVNTLDNTRTLHLDAELLSKDVLSQLRDVDWADAASRLSQQTLILQAAQQSFIRVSQLSLFNRM